MKTSRRRVLLLHPREMVKGVDERVGFLWIMDVKVRV